MRTQIPAALCLLLSGIAGSAASSLATFQDSECKKSANTVTGQNGYPDGVCTEMAEVAEAAYRSFMFISLDDGCTPTVYQNNTTSESCSGAAYVAYISECYNTSWAYYSIDNCTPLTSVSATSATSATSVASSSSSGISGGAIAGAVVGSVCGLGIIAAVCVYLFWFRPKQKDKARKEKEEAGNQNNEEGVLKAASPKPQEPLQQAVELHSAEARTELPNESIVEAPGDKGGVEVGNEAQVRAELPGDHEYRSGDSR